MNLDLVVSEKELIVEAIENYAEQLRARLNYSGTLPEVKESSALKYSQLAKLKIKFLMRKKK